MTEQQTAVAVYNFTLAHRDKTRDDDLARLQEAYPELRPVFEELQAWRDQE